MLAAKVRAARPGAGPRGTRGVVEAVRVLRAACEAAPDVERGAQWLKAVRTLESLVRERDALRSLLVQTDVRLAAMERDVDGGGGGLWKRKREEKVDDSWDEGAWTRRKRPRVCVSPSCPQRSPRPRPCPREP